ncbi:MAG: GNAT family N-acetyltransferase [Deltaproteobacteria bacterium]|nr:GNAT family N-acetyltransferase [Deltaproteobacteria bacterium]
MASTTSNRRPASRGSQRHAVRIRLAEASDLAFLAGNHRAMAWETEHRRLDPAVVRRGTRAVLHDPARGFYLVADLDGRPAGQLLVTHEWSDWRDGDFWWIQSVFVRPAFRRAGVYRMLHAAVSVLAAHAPSVRGLRLYAASTNRAAQRTYEKLGMTRTGYVVYEQLVRGVGRRRGRGARG